MGIGLLERYYIIRLQYKVEWSILYGHNHKYNTYMYNIFAV